MRGFGNGLGRSQLPSNNRPMSSNVIYDMEDGGGRGFQRNTREYQPFPNRDNHYSAMDMDRGRRYQNNMMQPKPALQGDNHYRGEEMDYDRSYEKNINQLHLLPRDNQSGSLNINMDFEMLRRKRNLIQKKKMYMNTDIQYDSPMRETFHEQPMFERRQKRNITNEDYNNSPGYSDQYKSPENYRKPLKPSVPKNVNEPSAPPKRISYYKNDKWVSQEYSRNTEPANGEKTFTFNNKKKPKVPKVAPAPKVISKKKIKVLEPKRILTEKELPTVQMQGRMEYSLGVILKDIKNKYRKDAVLLGCLQIPFIERIVKSIIRERITKVMMNKEVDNFLTILANYRKHYPLDEEQEIIKMLTDEKTESMDEECTNHNFIEIDDPKKFFRANMLQLLQQKVFDLLLNVENLYKNNNHKMLDLVDELPDIDNTDTNEQVTDETQNTADTIASNNTNNEKNDVDEEKLAKLRKYEQFMDLLIEERLPKILLSHKYDIVRMLSEKDFKALQADLVMETKHLVSKNIQNQKSDSNCSNSDKKQSDEVAKSGDVAEENKEPSDSAIENTGIDNTFYVMVSGNPTLPSKVELYKYLNMFNPDSIEKHNTNNDAVVVGFNDVTNYENVLKENGRKLGGITILIKERVKQNTEIATSESVTNDGGDCNEVV